MVLSVIKLAQDLKTLLDAKYGGENLGNLEYFEELCDLERWCQSRAKTYNEYCELAGFFDPEQVFNSPLSESQWQRFEEPIKDIPNHQGSLYTEQGREKLRQEFWAVNTKTQQTISRMPLLELLKIRGEMF